MYPVAGVYEKDTEDVLRTIVMITFEAISNRDALRGCKQRWDDIASRSSANAPYLSFQWYAIALKTIDRDKEPLLLFIREDERDIGLIPLVVEKRRRAFFSYYRIGFIDNAYTPHQKAIRFSTEYEILSPLMSFLRERFGWRFYLDLDEMRLSQQEEATFVERASRSGLILRSEKKMSSRYLLLKENFDRTLDTVDKRTRKEFRRKIHRLSKLGSIALIRVQDEKALQEHLDRFLEFRRRTWKGNEPYPEFYGGLCREFGALGQCYFHVLTLDDVPIAYLISFLGGDTMYGIQTTYDPSYYAFSPGVILFYKFIEEISSIEGLRVFDIGRGNEQFKREWTSLTYDHARMLLYPSTASWRLAIALRYRVMPFVRRHQSLNTAVTAARALTSPTADASGADDATSIRINYDRKRDDARKNLDHPLQFAARAATPADIDALAVAMAARNFKEIERLFERNHGIVITDRERVVACYWVPFEILSPDANRGELQTINVDHWGMIPRYACPECADICAQIALDWLEARGIRARGITLKIPGQSHLSVLAASSVAVSPSGQAPETK